MAQTVVTPNVAARTLSSALKRTISPKAVRTMARANIARFDKTRHPEYQPHAYTVAEMATLRKLFAARTGRAVAQAPRKAPSKPRAARKVAPVAPVQP